jgi:hypothetical protein
MYIVTSKPKRRSVKAGVVQAMVVSLISRLKFVAQTLKSDVTAELDRSDRIVGGTVRPDRWEILQFTLMIFMSLAGGFA